MCQLVSSEARGGQPLSGAGAGRGVTRPHYAELRADLTN